ncbi:DUF551 domain-containing protein [Lonsdalea britannica]|uniref:DUF551 domain-containing protein n=1 Tax=Lonsdalea britannica TaxID=1082704 RepID=A0AAD0WLV1_9GAMM|nr:DUF551 domain-containing protein [Lonsdalea britannica]
MSDWIKCSERMPAVSGYYHVIWNGKHISMAPFLFGSFQCIDPEKITHWMPLPEPPKE